MSVVHIDKVILSPNERTSWNSNTRLKRAISHLPAQPTNYWSKKIYGEGDEGVKKILLFYMWGNFIIEFLVDF